MMYSESDKSFQNEHTPCDTQVDCGVNMTRSGVRRAGDRRELKGSVFIMNR